MAFFFFGLRLLLSSLDILMRGVYFTGMGSV